MATSKRPRRARQRTQQPRRTRRVLSAQQILRTTLNAIPDLVWFKDKNGVYVNCNPAFERYFGAPEAAIVGKTDHDFVSAAQADAFRAYDQAAIDAGVPTRNEEWITLAEGGAPILLETTKTPVRDRGGRVVGVLGVARDITARWEAQQRLEAAQERFRALSEASFESLFISEKGRCLEQNQSARQTFGYSDEEAIGRMGTDWIDPADRALVLQNMMAGCTSPYEVRAQRKDGSTFAALLRGKMAHYQGRAVRVTSLLDITEVKAAEEALRRQTELLGCFYDMPFIGMSIIEPHTRRWLMVNDRFCQIVGYSREELLSMRWSDLTHPDDLAEGARRMQEVLEGRAPGYTRELRAVRKDGRVIHISVHIHATHHPDGSLDLIANTVQDITERKEHELALRIAATAFEAQEGMYITDARGTLLRVNAAFTLITGYSAAEAVGRTPALFHSGRQDAAFYAHLHQTLQAHGAWEGEIWNRRKNGAIYPQWLSITAVRGENQAISHYVATFVDNTQRKQAEEEIRHLAFYDPLTRLPNRRLLLDRLRQTLLTKARHPQVGALMFIDLDHFKTLNDTHGHDLGDALLVQVAQRLCATVRVQDTVARLGGDEFVVMLEALGATHADAAAQARVVAAKILEALNLPYRLGTREHHSTPSIGVALFDDASDTVDELLKRADLAMYQAKAVGRNAVQFFDPSMQALVSERARMQAELHTALAERQFVLHYQAQVDEHSRIIGVEALVRWQHPVRGLLGPGEFIGVAEETGLIVPLGQWVLEQACRQLAQWQGEGGPRVHWSMAVNLSARQFRERDFVQQVWATVRASGAHAPLVKLELTESLLAHDVEDIIDKMQALRAHGLCFSMDDFGTGYSSLSYLKRLPLQQLKIDRSFVRDVLTDANDAAIARTVVALGHTLGLTVLAEGVETAEQRQALLEMGCRHFQGYLFGHPSTQPAETHR